MSSQLGTYAAELRALADKIDGGEVQSVEVHHDWQSSTANLMSPRQMVYRITVTMPPDPLNLGYRIDELPNLPWTVRNSIGEAIAAYPTKDAADAHLARARAAREPGWAVTYDHWAAQNPGPRRSPWAESGPTTDRSD